MGEIAEMMQEGTLCSSCGVYLEESRGDFPQKCEDCVEDCPEERDPCGTCDGYLELEILVGCTCHIDPPCSSCENQGLVCDSCGREYSCD